MAGPSASDNYAGVFEGRLQPGTRPALLIVDVVVAYLTEGSPLFMATAAAAKDSNRRLAEAARAAIVARVATPLGYTGGDAADRAAQRQHLLGALRRHVHAPGTERAYGGHCVGVARKTTLDM